MKLMKHITIALVLCAIPAMAFGQAAECEGCDHQLPIYTGAAGLIATADGADAVNWKSTCGNTTKTGSKDADDDGIVSLLLADIDAMCDDDDGMFELGPIMDGGWFWMHRGENSGVGNLVAKAILENEMTPITDPGDSVTITDGAGFSVLMHVSGRFGVLPNILPVPEMDPVPTTYCGYTGTSAANYARLAMNCMLGDGSSTIRAQGEADAFTGDKETIMGGATVTRPKTAGTSVDITYDLWIDPGSHVTDASATGAGIVLGQAGAAGASPLSASFSAVAGSDGPVNFADLAAAGLTLTPGTNEATLAIAPEDTLCSSTANHSVTVTVTADATTPTEVTPAVKENAAANAAATHKITVVCAAGAGSQQGVELVPENPFPVE